MIFGQHVALVLAREVDPAVADVRDEAAQVLARPGDQEHRRGRAHAALVGLGLSARVHRGARLLHRVLEDLEHLVRLDAGVIDAVAVEQIAVRVDRIADLVHRDRRGDFARRVATHTVGDHEQAELLIDEEVILVVVPLPSDVGRGGERELHPFFG